MGTRSGDLDPATLQYIMKRDGIDIEEMTNILNKKSGLLGISGISSDMRDLTAAMEEGNERATLAIKMMTYRLKKYIAGYAAAMGGVDAIVFTGGIGENVGHIRKAAVEGLSSGLSSSMRPRTTSPAPTGSSRPRIPRSRSWSSRPTRSWPSRATPSSSAARRRKAVRAEKQTKFLLRAKNSLTKRGLPSIIGKWLCAR